ARPRRPGSADSLPRRPSLSCRSTDDPESRMTTAADATPPPPPRRLYMDNAATSFPKPKAVTEAMVRYATQLGASAGRGAYREAIEASNILSECRRRLNQLFNGEAPEHFIFTLNCSDALNLAIKGLV